MNNSQSTEYRLLELGQLPRVWGGGEGQWLEAWGARARKQGGVWECGLAATARCLSVVTNTRRMRPWSYSCRT